MKKGKNTVKLYILTFNFRVNGSRTAYMDFLN